MIEPPRSPSFAPRRWRWIIVICGVLFLTASGCDRSPFNETERAMDQAEQKLAAKDYRGAVNSYEKALDGTTKTADTHFRLGVLYDEKLSDPVSAVHHFRRYIELLPSGPHAKEAKADLDRIELTLATSLAGGTLITHSEAARLKNENKELRQQLAALGGGATSFPSSGAAASGINSRGPDGTANGKLAPGSRTYQVQPGDTLASIARKFYKNKARAKDIQDANINSVPNAAKLRPGTTLIIP